VGYQHFLQAKHTILYELLQSENLVEAAAPPSPKAFSSMMGREVDEVHVLSCWTYKDLQVHVLSLH